MGHSNSSVNAGDGVGISVETAYAAVAALELPVDLRELVK